MEIAIWVAYCYAGVFLLFAIAIYFPRKKTEARFNNLISVCVPFRNEKTQLDRHCLSLHNLHDTMFEVHYCDDHSYDDSASVCFRYGFDVHSVSQGEGKIAALHTAVEHAHGELLVFTDADCDVLPTWISELRDSYSEETGLFVGTVAVERMPVMTIDFLCLIGVAAALYTLGIPSSCPGANIAVKKSIYTSFLADVDQKHATDDAALLHYVHSIARQRIRFIFSPNHTVMTRAYRSVGEFLSQRFRWVKGGIHLNPFLTLYLFFILCAHGLFFAFPSLLWVPITCAGGFALIMILRMRKYSLLPYVPLYGIFFPVYTTIIGLIFPFVSRSLRWKGRSL